MNRKSMQDKLDSLTRDELILLGKMLGDLQVQQSKSDDRTGIAAYAVRKFVPKASKSDVYNKWVPALKAQGLEHEPLNGRFRNA